MEMGKVQNVAPKKRPKKILKIFVLLLGVFIFLVVVAVLLVPSFVSSDKARQIILDKANKAIDGKLDFSALSMGWIRGIVVRDISFRDKAESVSVAVKQVSTRPHYAALLTGGLSFGRTVIDEPRIQLNVTGMQKGTAKAATQTTTGKKTTQPVVLPVSNIDLVVNNGNVKVSKDGQAVEISGINSKVDLRPAGEQSNFDMNAAIREGNKQSTISAKGQLTPSAKAGWGIEGMVGNLTIEVNALDLGSLESILAIGGVDIAAKGVVSVNLNGAVDDGKLKTLEGQVTGRGLEVGGAALKGDTIKTSKLDLQVQVKGDGDLINVEKLDLATDWAKVQASGVVPTSAKTLEEFTAADSKYELKGSLECDVPAVVSQLPRTLGLKEQTKLTGGKLVGNIQTLSEAGQKKLAGVVTLDGLAGTVEGKPIALSAPIRAEAKVGTEGKQVKFDKLSVTSAFAAVDCAGGTNALSYNAQVDLAKLAGELGQFADLAKYKLGGQFTSKGQLTNDGKRTSLVSSSNITNLQISPTSGVTVSEPKAAVEIIAAIDKSRNVLSIEKLSADTSFGQFNVKNGALPLGKGTKEPMSLVASARGVDLAKLQPYLAASGVMAKDVQLAGVVESDVTISSKQDSYRIITDSTKIANLRVVSPGKQPFVQEQVLFVFDGEVNPTTKNWAVNKAEITGPNIKIKCSIQQKVEGQTSSLQGSAQLDYDWKTLSGMLAAFIPSELVIEGKRNDAISFSSRYPTGKTDAMLANLNAQAKVGFDKVAYMGLNMGTTNVDLKVDKGFMTIAPFTATVNNGQLNFGGSADFKQKPAIFRTPGPMNVIKDVQINKEMANKLLAKVNPIFFGVSSISGSANLQCDQLAVPINGGKPEDANIAGTISLTQVKMQPTGLMGAILTATGASEGELITIHPTPFTVKDGLVRYPNMQMDIGSMPINFSGSVPLDPNRKIESFSVTLPVTAMGKMVKTGKDAGAGGITAYVKGTPNNPKLDLGKMIQEQAIQTGLELLLEQVKKK
jgi:hypothetical protein